MKLNIAVLPGDGIGPETTNQAIKVLKAIALEFNHTFLFKEALIGAIAINQNNNPLPDYTLNLCKSSDAILLGTIGKAIFENDAKMSPEQGVTTLKKELDLHTSVLQIKAYSCLIEKSPLKKEIIEGTDICVYSNQANMIYFGKKHLNKDEIITSDLFEYSKQEIERVTNLAFKKAQNRNKKMTLVDKANALETSSLWEKAVKELATKYPDVVLDFMLVKDAAKQIILNPKQFDVILSDKLFGDIISSEASIISGIPNLSASASIGDKYAMFKPNHGSYTEATDKGIANPLASILSAAMLLEHFELFEEAKIIKKGVEKSLKLKITTPDLNNTYDNVSTSKVGDFIADFISNPYDTNINFNNIHLGQSTII